MVVGDVPSTVLIDMALERRLRRNIKVHGEQR
jgi:hypothetical protein